MPEFGPRDLIVEKGLVIPGQSGPSLDSDLLDLYIQPGSKVSVWLRSEEECMVFSTREGSVYIQIPPNVSLPFDKLMPTVREILTAQGRILQMDGLDEVLKDLLISMLEGSDR
jgi:hypothetical protein